MSEKRKKEYLTLDQKVEIIKKVESGEKIVTLSEQYHVDRSTIWRIVKDKENILKFFDKLQKEEGDSSRKTRKYAKAPDLETALYLWFKQKRSLGEPVSGPVLQEKARYFADRLGHSSSFKASEGWLNNFRKRHGIRQLSIQGERLSSNEEMATRFKTEFLQIVQINEYLEENIYNADETGLQWKCLPSKTLVLKSEKSAPGFKTSKERVTVLLCANVTGQHKLKPFVIGKYNKPRCLKNVRPETLPVTYGAQRSGWIDRNLFLEWYKNQFIKCVEEIKPNSKILLLLDNAPAHLSDEELNSINPNFRVVFLPPNVTALIQPLDQGVIEKVKRLYKSKYLRKFSFMENINIEEYITKTNLLDCFELLHVAWNSVTAENLKNSWKNLLPNVDTPTEDSQEEIRLIINDIIERIPSEIEINEAELENWLTSDEKDPGYKILSDEEIVQELIERKTPEKESDEESEEEVLSPREIVKCLNSTIKWVQRQSECNERQLNILYELKNLAISKTDKK